MFKFKFSGGDRVKEGHYWNFSTGERMRLEEEGILPGDSKDIYLRARSGFLLLVVAPFLGLAYAFFLPAVTIATVVIVAIRKVMDILGQVWILSPARRRLARISSEKNR